MTITLYRTSPTVTAAMALHHALADCFASLGIQYAERDPWDYQESEVAVVHGWLKKLLEGTRYDRAPVINAQIKAGKQVICCERGMWDRGNTHILAWDGMLSSADWSYLTGMPGDRWEKSGKTLAPWRVEKPGQHILFCGQDPFDANLFGQDHVGWIRDTLLRLANNQSRPVRFRGHPKALHRRGPKTYAAAAPAFAHPNVQVSDPHKAPIEADLANAWAVVCWNSLSATDATFAGVPAFTFDSNSMAYDVTCHDLARIDDPPTFDRQQWAHDLAYRQWSTEEVRSGEAWEYVGRGMKS